MMKSKGYEAEAPQYAQGEDVVRNPADLQKLKPLNSMITFWTDRNNNFYCPVWDAKLDKVRLLHVKSKAVVDHPLNYPLFRRDN
jgi:hypothetical protein